MKRLRLISAPQTLALVWLAATVSLGAAAPAVEAPRAAWSELFRVPVPAAQTLRGFGRVEAEFAGFQQGGQRVWVQTFRCENAEKAGVVVGKFLADVALSEGVTAGGIAVGGRKLPALTTREGAVFIGCRAGAEARILDASSREALTASLRPVRNW